MAHTLAGVVEAHARSKQYEYEANSSLVLTTDTGPRDPHGSTRPESLWGKIDPKTFGDRASWGTFPESQKKKKKEGDPFGEKQSKRRRLQKESVLTFTDEEGAYQPKTKQTRAAYEAMLGLIQQQLGGQPLSIVTSAADEILALLKNLNIDKKKEIEKVLRSPIPSHVFDQFVSIGKLITDYHEGNDVANNGDCDALDDCVVAVEFEDNEKDEEQSDFVMMQEEEEDQDDSVEPYGTGALMQMGGGIDDDDMQEETEGMILHDQDIDAYWLQRKISQAYREQQIDPQQCLALAEEVLKILAEDSDDSIVESKLLAHIQFDKFSLIRFLLRNRLKIVWCTRLARAGDQDEKRAIEEEMMGLGPDVASILEQLHHTRATAKERLKNFEKSIREEASRLKDESSVNFPNKDRESAWLKIQGQLVDLDSLASEQDGFFTAEKKCDLPIGSYRHLRKEYEEIHVPAMKAKPLDPNENLVNISAMPDWAKPAFKGMIQLNRIQSKVYDTALFDSDNILLCAPTGAGKTNVAVLTILQQIALHRIMVSKLGRSVETKQLPAHS